MLDTSERRYPLLCMTGMTDMDSLRGELKSSSKDKPRINRYVYEVSTKAISFNVLVNDRVDIESLKS